MSVLHCMMMSHGGELLARYRVVGVAGLKLQVSTLKNQVSGLNDKLASSDASFAKSKAKGKERKKRSSPLPKVYIICMPSAGFKHGLSMHWTKDEFATVLKKMANFMLGAQDRLAEAFPLDARVSPSTIKESTMTLASKSLELSTNVDLTASTVDSKHNEEMVNAEDVVELAEVESGHASSSPNDVVVALSVGEKGDGLVPSSAAGEE
ncbi:hypothetical protein Tco_1008393, partial [Tanacetum coccineum]